MPFISFLSSEFIEVVLVIFVSKIFVTFLGINVCDANNLIAHNC